MNAILKIKQFFCFHKASSKPSKVIWVEKGLFKDYTVHLRECAKCSKIAEFKIKMKK